MRGVWDGTIAGITGLTSPMPTVEAYSDTYQNYFKSIVLSPVTSMTPDWTIFFYTFSRLLSHIGLGLKILLILRGCQCQRAGPLHQDFIAHLELRLLDPLALGWASLIALTLQWGRVVYTEFPPWVFFPFSMSIPIILTEDWGGGDKIPAFWKCSKTCHRCQCLIKYH